MTDQKDNTAQQKQNEVDFNMGKCSGLWGNIYDMHRLVEENESQIPLEKNLYDVQDPTIREFGRIYYSENLNEMIGFIGKFSDSDIRDLFCEEVLLGYKSTGSHFLSRPEGCGSLLEFLSFSVNLDREFFRQMNFLNKMKHHRERVALQYPLRTDYLESEKQLLEEGWAKITTTMNSDEKVSYKGFYYPNPFINPLNITGSKLAKDLSNLDNTLNYDEIEEILNRIFMYHTISGDVPSRKELKIIKQLETSKIGKY